MKVHRNVSRPDTSAWPEFDQGALTPAQRKTFSARRRAVEMFVADTSLAEIEAQTGVNRRQVYRAVESATALHADGRELDAVSFRVRGVPRPRLSAAD